MSNGIFGLDKLPEGLKPLSNGIDRLNKLQDALKPEKIGIDSLNKLPDGLKSAERPDRLIGPQTGSQPSFSKVMGNLIHDVDSLHKTAAKATEKLVTGELEDVHQVVVAMEEAHISFRLMMEIRNKMVEAYKEVMKTQV